MLSPSVFFEIFPDASKLCQIKSVKVHHLSPCGYKVVYNFVLRIFAGINFSQCT